MTRPLSGAVLLLGTLTACADGDDVSPRGPQLLLPDDVELHWDESFNREADGLGALIAVDVMVYEAGTGAPLEQVEVQLETSDPGTWLLLDDDFLVVAPEVCADCPFLWDARRDQYFVLRVSELHGGDDDAVRWWDEGAPLEDLHRIVLDTDADGLARVYLFVDAFPWDDEAATFEPVSVLVSLGTADAGISAEHHAYFELAPR